MLHPYELSTGEIVFVECGAEVIDFLVESKRADENADRRHRYNCPYHIEAIEYEGLEYADPETPEASSPMRSTKAMPFCRRPSLWIF